MTNLTHLLRLLAETESILTRETETILSGATINDTDVLRKTDLMGRLIVAAPHTGHLAYASDANGRQQLRDGFERMLQAAARNEAVLRGALRGSRLITSALREGSTAYANACLPKRPSEFVPHSGQIDRLA
jgi:hypothetical protein